MFDWLFFVITLGIGWFIWLAIVAPRGQTPSKQLLGMYVLRDDGSRAGGGYVWLREVVVKWLLFGVAISVIVHGIAFSISALWCLGNRERQCLWDKVTATYVGHSPIGYRPLAGC